MDIQVWPAGLEHYPEKKGYKFRPGKTRSRTQMEQGTRDRPEIPFAPAEVELTWSFSLGKFKLFMHWYRLALLDGTRWFRMPVWNNTGWQDSLCLFTGAYEPTLQGARWRVAAKLAVRPFIVEEA